MKRSFQEWKEGTFTFHFLVLEFLLCLSIAGFIAMYATLASRDVVS
jgi:hypothetical protein